MHLLLLHGQPATGKYTVGRELAALTGFELYHNHLVVDDILRRHAFGTPEFIAERDLRWRDYFQKAAAGADRRIIFTFNPESTVPQAFIDWLFGSVTGSGSKLTAVELTANESELETRMGSTQRHQFGKLTDLALYRQLRDSGSFQTPRIPRTDLRLDTSARPPLETAWIIAGHFQLC